jgi:two-component system, OmpR family, response regulator
MTRQRDNAAHILVVDDDQRIRQMLSRYFDQEGYRVSVAADGSALRAQLTDSIDVILLDVVMPGEDGVTLAREIRAKSDVGIIMLTGRDDVLDRIVGLEVGADDYIPKPFHLREVLARVKSLLRRRRQMPPAATGEVIRFEGWRLDVARRQLISPKGEDVALTTGEFDLLAALARHPGRVLGREALMDLTRGRNWETFDRTIDAQVARLRKKIEADPKNPMLVKSVRNIGYVFTGKVDRQPELCSVHAHEEISCLRRRPARLAGTARDRFAQCSCGYADPPKFHGSFPRIGSRSRRTHRICPSENRSALPPHLRRQRRSTR